MWSQSAEKDDGTGVSLEKWEIKKSLGRGKGCALSRAPGELVLWAQYLWMAIHLMGYDMLEGAVQCERSYSASVRDMTFSLRSRLFSISLQRPILSLQTAPSFPQTQEQGSR